MRNFVACESARNHADHLAAEREHRVGERTHESDAPAAVDQAKPASVQRLRDLGCELPVRGVRTGMGATEDTEPSHAKGLCMPKPAMPADGVIRVARERRRASVVSLI